MFLTSQSFIDRLNERFFAFWEKFANNYPSLIWMIVIILPFIEALIPILPLVVIVMFNIQILTPLVGAKLSAIIAIVLSAIGSFLGFVLIFFLIRGTFGVRLRARIEKNPKVLPIIEWIENRSTLFITLAMSNPYIPVSIFNYALAIMNIETNRYLIIIAISRFVCIALLALLGTVFKVQNNLFAIVWIILVYVAIYLIVFIIRKLININK